MLQNLIHFLIRIRQHQHAVFAVFVSKFIRVGVLPKDEPPLCFPWWEDTAEEMTVYRYVHHSFGANDLPTCALYELKRNATNIEASFPEAAVSVKINLYIKKYLEWSLIPEEAKRKAQDFAEMLAKGAFTRTKFVSNNRGVL